MKPKRTLSFLLAIMMMFSLLPVNLVSVSASETTTTEKNITLGTSALKGGQASNVYFGNYQQSSLDNTEPTEGTEGIDWIKNSNGQINGQGAYYKKDPIKWRVLSNADGKAFLLSDKNLDVVRYHENYDSVTWATSTIRSWLNGYGATSNIGGTDGIDYTSDNFIGSAFSENEKKGIVSTTVEKNTEEDIQDKVFLLSIAEAQNTSYFADNDSRKAVNTAYVRGGGKTGTSSMYDIGVANSWWLRSNGRTNRNAVCVDNYGVVGGSSYRVDNDENAVRPAFNLNLSSVLFTSAAENGKKTNNVGTLFANADNSGNEYKLTMKDDSREFAVTEDSITVPKDGSATISYEKAKTGTNEYISAMLLNENDEVLYYGQIKNVTSSSEADGKATVEIPASVDTGTYTLRVFNEQINGDKKTDFSSDFVDVTLNVVKEKNITLGTSALSGYDSTNVYKYVYYGTYESNPIKWRILTMNGNEGTYKDNNDETVDSANAMFLLSEYGLKQMAYDSDGTDNNQQNDVSDWRHSDAWNWCNNTTADTSFIGSSFTDSEKVYFLKTSKDNSLTNGYTDALNEDTFFFLSINEANSDYIKNNRAAKMSGENGNSVWWWLRSPHHGDGVHRVDDSGNIKYIYVAAYDLAARPAFNLNLSSVLFTSAAESGKSATVGTLSANAENTGNEYKLTMKDDSREFAVTEDSITVPKGGSATITYENAETGTNEYISAMLLNDDDEVLYYGQIKNVTSSSEADGKATVEIPASVNTGTYTLRVFNEQINGDKKTDISSAFVDVTLNVVTEKNITLGTSALSGYDSTNGYKYVYYGTYESNPIKWRVLDTAYKYDETDPSKTGMLVLSENALAKTEFGTSNTWNGSTVQGWCTDIYNNSFGANEQKYILETNSDDILNNDRLFFLSYDEAYNSKYFPSDSNRIAYLNGWWLRSPLGSPFGNIYVSCVDDNGLIDLSDVRDADTAARPAFNLNPASVLFTSAAENGKKTSNVGTLFENADNSGSEYKLTMKDDSREFAVTETSAKGTKGESITLNYDKAQPGTNEYISAMIVKNSEVLYYGQGEKTEVSTNDDTPVTEKGKVKFTLPGDIENGEYTLYVFNEQINGDKKTDFSSAFQTVTLNVLLSKATFTTAPAAKTDLTYDGTEQELVTAGATNNGTVKYSLSENGTYSTDIPKGKNADAYMVWYYIEGDDSHSDSDKASVKVTIAKADSQTTTTADATVTYGETLTLTATVTKAARAPLNNVAFYVGENDDAELLGTVDVTSHGTATLTIDTKQRQLKIGDNRITAEYGGSVNLNGSNSDTITVMLNQKEVGLTWSGYNNRDYDGTPSNVTATATDIESGDGAIGVTVTGGTETNAGNHTATATALTGTYAEYYKLPTDNTKDYTISPKTVTATIGDIADQTYTGSEIKPQITVYDDDGTTVIPASEYTVGYSNNTNAGTATVTLTDSAGGNYTVSGSTTFTIKKLPVIIGWSDTTGWVYDGISKTVTAEVSNTCGNDEVNLTFSDNSDSLTQSEKGTYTATVTAVDNPNYTVDGGQNLEKNWSIAQANDNDITGLEIDGWTYGDTANTPTATAKYGTPTFSYSTEENGTYTDTVPTNAGTYWVMATVVGTENYAEVSSEPILFEIAQATPTENPEKKTTARVRRGRTLAEATVTEGEILGINDTVLEGTFAWVDDTKTMSADGTEQMTFTPNDTNYAPITIDVEVSTYSSGGGGSTSRYTVKFDTDGGNTITSQTVTKNSKATEPKTPTKEGFVFDGWYTDSKLTTEYDFDTKVTKNITLYAKWVEDEVQEPSDDKKDDEQKPITGEWKNPFTDVKETDWFFDNVRYANENGLMSGTTDTTFAPNDNLTRGMLVTVLYRAEGEPAVNKSIPFADVTADSYYANAVIWAEQNGIVKGVSETEFAPDENITREQIATIIYRYAEYKGIAPTGAWAIKLDYADVADISDYAVEGVMYCTMKNIMQGKDNNMFAPKDNATRAEIAAILNRFIESNK